MNILLMLLPDQMSQRNNLGLTLNYRNVILNAWNVLIAELHEDQIMDAVFPVVGHAKYASCVSHRGFHFVSFSLSRVNYTDKQAGTEIHTWEIHNYSSTNWTSPVVDMEISFLHWLVCCGILLFLSASIRSHRPDERERANEYRATWTKQNSDIEIGGIRRTQLQSVRATWPDPVKHINGEEEAGKRGRRSRILSSSFSLSL